MRKRMTTFPDGDLKGKLLFVMNSVDEPERDGWMDGCPIESQLSAQTDSNAKYLKRQKSGAIRTVKSIIAEEISAYPTGSG